MVPLLPKWRWQCVNGSCREAGGGYGCIPLEKGHVYNYNIITAEERRAICRYSSEEEHSLDKRKADISKLSNGTSLYLVGVMVAQETPNLLAGVRFSHGIP